MGRPKLPYCPHCGALRKETRRSLRKRLQLFIQEHPTEYRNRDLFMAAFGASTIHCKVEKIMQQALAKLGYGYVPSSDPRDEVWVREQDDD